jgi:DNA repair protein RecN (Recombination protein N)
MGLRAELEELEGGRREAEQRLDLLRFQVQEIEGARLDPGEEASLEVERNLLANAERLTHLSGVAYEALQGSADSVVDALAAASSAVGDLAEIDPALGPLRDRLTSARYEVEDVSQDLRQYRDGVEYDPARLNEIEERVDLLSRLKRKYGTTLADVISFGGEARAEMEAVENLDERLEDLRRRLDEGAEQTAAVVWDLSKQRIATAGALEAAMSFALQGLGLKGTSFHVRLEQSERADGLQVPDGRRLAVSTSGIDSVTFEVSFNPGEPIRPLDRVASGGETSRFLLALKSVLAEADETPTLIFDEVDVGVGGRRAADVGERMRQLAGHHQVISITHMPQIAAMADQHLTVSKRVTAGRTTVDVRGLDRADRIAEIAEMMTGTGSEVARQNARELLEAAHRGE